MIKPVRKVKVIVPKDKKEELLITLQKENTIMFDKYTDSNIVDVEYEEEIISRTNSIINKLGEYKKKNRKFFQYNTVNYNEFIKDPKERIELLEKTEKLLDDLYFLTSENEEEKNSLKQVEPYKDLKYSTKELSELSYISVHMGYVPEARYEFFKDYASRQNQYYFVFKQTELGIHVLIYLDKDIAKEELNKLERFGFVEEKLPIIEETLKTYISNKQNIIDDNNKKIQEITKSLSNIADNSELELEILNDQMLSQIERKLVKYSKTDNDYIFFGWISEEKAETLQPVVRKVTLEYQIEFEEPTKFDNVPTLLSNNKFVEPFESITNTYSVPNYREIDPNPIMSFWYFILFGLMVGDIGYGLIMITIFGLFLKLKKPKGEMGSLVKVLFYTGFSTMIAGFVYGSLFGINIIPTIGKILGTGWTEPLLSPMNDPITMLIFSIGFGAVHIMSGLVMKIILSIKQKDILTGLSEGLSWLLIILGIAFVAIGLVASSIFTTIGIILLALGILAMFVFGGMKKNSVLGKIFGGVSGLFGITEYLNHLLSYSRVLALALSSAVIAFTFNTLAGLLQGNIIGILFSVIVYIVGHVFNFLVSLLSTYVHGNRLQYLEFYGKFYQGGGYIFTPLGFKLQYINEITN